ncbi:HNH endonuclease [archaeon SCG-AAA382B04]|nr:HNH endonuclease [archaeon SCG-AAA382B04]
MSKKVYVQNKDGSPLMPCKPAKARHLLRDKKAEVVRREPFTIRLRWNCESNTQEARLGVDMGAKKAGVSAVREDGQVLYQSKVELRTDIRSKMDKRRKYRRARRTRKTRYREPRFDNRRREKRWLPPTLKSKANSTVKVARQVANPLPINEVTVEVAPFNMQKLKNPKIQREEYQNRELKRHTSVRQYVLYRDKHQCINCKESDVPLQVHHIKPRNKGETEKPNNMVSLCVKCHEKLHKGEIELSKKSLKYWTNKEYKYASHINSMKNHIVDELRKLFNNVQITFGNITKTVRKKLGLEKTDVNDAIAIAIAITIASLDFTKNIKKLPHTFIQKCLPTGRYQLHKGKRSEKRVPTKGFNGFNQWDKVKLPSGTVGFVKGKRSSGYFDVSDIYGNSYTHSVKYEKLDLISKAGTTIMEVKGNSSPT